MLSQSEIRLLTAHVDGELGGHKRRQLARLLRRSKYAREMLRRLLQDAEAIRRIPKVSAPIDLVASVLNRIEKLPPQPVKVARITPAPDPIAAPRPSIVWTGYAAAAAVLLLVGLGSFLYHLSETRAPGERNTNIAQGNQSNQLLEKEKAQPLVKLPPPNEQPVSSKGSRSEQDRTNFPSPFEEPDDLNIPDFPEKRKPLPTEQPKESVLTAGGQDLVRRLEKVTLMLPQVHRLHELDDEKQSQTLQAQLEKTQAVRIELLARDATRGFDRVRHALASKHIQVTLDPATQLRLKKPTWKTDYTLFFENITPRDLTDVLNKIGISDRPGTAKPGETRFDGALVVKDLSRWDRRELFELLGVDPIAVRPEPLSKTSDIDIRKPLTESTVNRVTAILQGKGPRRNQGGNSTEAYVQVLNSPRTRPMDLKRYLERRIPAQTGTLQVFLILRNIP